VSPQRLNTTIERIMQHHLKADGFIAQENKNEFLNGVITGKIKNPEVILQKAKMLNIDFTQSFSLFFLLIYNIDNQNMWETLAGKDPQLNVFIEELSAYKHLVVWQTDQGIGILDFSSTASDDYKSEELIAADKIKAIAEKNFPDKTVGIGIAKHYTKLESFPERYVQARNAAVIGMRVSPNLVGIYHIVDSAFLPVLNQYIAKESADILIDSTIGKLIAHDRVTGADLFHTMEMIILNHSFQEVANLLFIHYKTVLFRKQAIEKILGISMNSFAGRTILGVALTLFYLRDIADIHNE
jgi:sugar diacid utilization regulator